MVNFLNSKLHPWNWSILKLKDLILTKQRPLEIYLKSAESGSTIYAKPVQFAFNNCIANGLFPEILKVADGTSLHKGYERTS